MHPFSAPGKMAGPAIAHVHFFGGVVEQIGFCVGSAVMREKEWIINLSSSVKESNKQVHSGAAGRC